MHKKSAGILLYRRTGAETEFMLVHPGGPFFKKKDLGNWTIPKGEFEGDETALNAAQREFFEETGKKVEGDFIELSPVVQKSGKQVFAWAVEGDFDVSTLKSNTFSIEWPFGSGTKKEFPEIDRAEWFSLPEALQKINPAQQAFLHELLMLLQ